MSAARSLRLDIVRNDDGQWFWRLCSTNGKELCRSSETYTRRQNCDNSARLSLDLWPYRGLGVLKDGDLYDDERREPIRVQVLA